MKKRIVIGVDNATYMLHTLLARPLKPRELLKIAIQHGWHHDRTTGGHWILVKKGFRSVPISSHAREFPISFVKTILKQLGIFPREVFKK